jgi:diacylglycerol kinase family enzyme
VVAGDGTARCAAELAGPKGMLVAPLPGGTMNMLPRQLYGGRAWDAALREILTDGEVRSVSGGAVGDRTFFVAAILGSPAHWADAREAVREGHVWLAVQRARRALKRAFSSRLRYRLDAGATERTEALTLMCPLVSRAMDADDQFLEAAAVDPKGATEIFRLGAALVAGRWRDDPAVAVRPCREGAVWSKGRIPALLDGEPARFDRETTIRFIPDAFKALVPKGEIE